MLSSSARSLVQVAPAPEVLAEPSDPDLHRVLLPLLRRGSRLALLGSNEALLRRLEAAGCSVIHRPLASLGDKVPGTVLSASLRGELEALVPEVVILLDDWVSLPSPEAVLQAVRTAAPQAALAVLFRNAGSASSLLGLLQGQSGPPSVTEAQVHGWLAAQGLSLLQRHVLGEAQAAGERLSLDTERNLRQLFEQLNPSSAASRLLYWLGEPIESVLPVAPARAYEPGLLSVIIRNQSLSRLGYLDHAIFSLACQEHESLEIVISSQAREPGVVEAIQRILERHQPTGRYRFQILLEPSERDIRARLLNTGLQAARGQYVAFLDDDDVIYPQHYHRLITLLREGHAAWAVGRTQRAYFRKSAQGDLYCYSKVVMPRPESFDLAALVRENYITCHSYVVDRERLGCFPLEFSEQMTVLEDYVFLLRLAALFRPDFVSGAVSCEYRIREDGTNSVVTQGLTEQQRVDREQQWSLARHATHLAKRSFMMVMSEREFEHHLETARVQAQALALGEVPTRVAASLREIPRYQLTDQINATVKHKLPGIHRLLRFMARGVLS